MDINYIYKSADNMETYNEIINIDQCNVNINSGKMPLPTSLHINQGSTGHPIYPLSTSLAGDIVFCGMATTKNYQLEQLLAGLSIGDSVDLSKATHNQLRFFPQGPFRGGNS